jgi:hypothetical protein
MWDMNGRRIQYTPGNVSIRAVSGQGVSTGTPEIPTGSNRLYGSIVQGRSHQFTTAGLKQKTRKEMSDYNAISLWQPSLIQAARVRHGKAQFASIVQGDFGTPLVKPVVRNDRLIPECGNFVIMLQRPFHHVPDILTRDIHGIGLIESLQEALPSTIANGGFLHLYSFHPML